METFDPLINNEKKSFCMNCGKIGHLSKKCLCPIISIGIICIKMNIDNSDYIDLNSIISYTKKIQNNYLFTLDEIYKLKYIKEILDKYDSMDDIIEYLLIRRRNSLNYVELIRGKYDVYNLDYIEKSINLITSDERDLIRNNTFDTLWKKLWGEDIINNYNEYKESLEKFNLLKNGFYIKKNDIHLHISFNKLMNDVVYNYKEAEWGFPKGRRNCKEKNIECAKREFEEETTIPFDNIHIINMTPLEETYIASNSLKYKHIYYISQIKNNNLELKIDDENKEQRIEIGDIRWFKFKDGLNIIREYNIEKKHILLNLHLNIKYTIENFKSILENFLKDCKCL
jgi:8-oxo-dGTP pyrophosphatase MutT (NUDIX family)